MPTLRIVFEFEQDEARVTPALLENFWPRSEGEAEHRRLGVESELALLAAVQARPEVKRQLWLQQALTWLYFLESPEVIDLVKPFPRDADLKALAAELSEYARGYFLEDGMINGMDHELLVHAVQRLRLCRVQVEDAEGVMLSSDDAPRRRGGKKKAG